MAQADDELVALAYSFLQTMEDERPRQKRKLVEAFSPVKLGEAIQVLLTAVEEGKQDIDAEKVLRLVLNAVKLSSVRSVILSVSLTRFQNTQMFSSITNDDLAVLGMRPAGDIIVYERILVSVIPSATFKETVKRILSFWNLHVRHTSFIAFCSWFSWKWDAEL